MKRYEITATVKVEIRMPDDFNPETHGEDILYSLDMYTDERGIGGWRMFMETVKNHAEFLNVSHREI